MSPVAAGVMGIAVLLVLLALGMPVGAVMALIGFVGTIYIIGLDGALGIMGIIPYDAMWSYVLSCTPMFILMGAIILHSGIAKFIYAAAHKWLGHLPGGLGMATVAACGMFAAVSGSSLAAAATMGSVALPEMDRYNYKKSFSTGIVAAGGTIGIMIPPSIIFIIYAVLTEESIGALFMAGLIPGILEVILYIGVIALIMKFRPHYAARAERVPFRDMLTTIPSLWPVFLLFVIVLGGIYFGFFTPTEAGAIGAVGALIISVASRWFSPQKMLSALSDTVKTTGMIFFIVVGAMIYSYFLAVTQLPFAIAESAAASALPPHGVLVIVLFIYLILGCFLDALAMMMLTVPIFTPVLFALGFNPIWTGVIIVRVIEIALITPPLGMNVYVLKGVAKDVPMEQIFFGIIPFVVGDLILLAILVAFPQISLFLPSLMYNIGQ
ncbi:TRAP transporter large permease [Chloroflexota bacterium]